MNKKVMDTEKNIKRNCANTVGKRRGEWKQRGNQQFKRKNPPEKKQGKKRGLPAVTIVEQGLHPNPGPPKETPPPRTNKGRATEGGCTDADDEDERLQVMKRPAGKKAKVTTEAKKDEKKRGKEEEVVNTKPAKKMKVTEGEEKKEATKAVKKIKGVTRRRRQ